MDGQPLDPHEAQALAALLRVNTPLTGRAVARVTGMSQSTAQRALTRLRERGLVGAEAAPPSLLYRANRDHLAMPPLVRLLHLDDELRTRMSDEVSRWRVPAAAVIVYGSVARGEANPRSDLDVLVVRGEGTEPDDSEWQQQVSGLAEAVHRWTGRAASVMDLGLSEAVEGLANREPYLAQADHEGWLIAGRALRELG